MMGSRSDNKHKEHVYHLSLRTFLQNKTGKKTEGHWLTQKNRLMQVHSENS